MGYILHQRGTSNFHRPIDVWVDLIPKKQTMLKFVNENNDLQVAIVFDKSSSMNSCRSNAIESLNLQLKSFREEAKKTSIPTFINLLTFSDYVSQDMVNIPVQDTKDIDLNSYITDGWTALYDGIGEAITILESKKAKRNLILIITDGQENRSKKESIWSIQSRIKTCYNANNFTFAMCVPPRSRDSISVTLGIPKESIIEWETTKESIVELTSCVRSANTSLYSSYQAGNTMSCNYFSPQLTGLENTIVQTNLDDLSNDFKVLNVPAKEAIGSFVSRNTNKPYKIGSAFYQLTKKENVQANKDLLIRSRNDDKIYGGDNARSILRIPSGGNIELNPAASNDYDVFVCSTSHNRNLVPNTKLLVKK